MTATTPQHRNEVLSRFDTLANEAAAAALHQSRARFSLQAGFILDNTHVNREQSLALTALEQAKFWTNQAIALHGVPQKTPTDYSGTKATA
ncbi:hypothetical protein [Frigoribacterium sp. CG_9.8]|uniref:Acb2/Tad1 domain-containing protein n=1 Tax=Frigoribacterium sp. CG_9.8 TaxID=2787733 RepID=UPI0018C8FE4B|nr:hypothetical protein [Frigoribacterium sp. CG_9.8]MBG6106574.1 hypothetical protein [Frigoribacterium sp. CG_9.8]